jgi:hypothetical protein
VVGVSAHVCRGNLVKPVADLHRAQGAFDTDARARAFIYPGASTRATLVAAGRRFSSRSVSWPLPLRSCRYAPLIF